MTDITETESSERVERIPAEVCDNLRRFHQTLTDLEEALQPHFASVPPDQRPPLQRARNDVLSLFCINSLYWMLLCTHGKNPRENEMLTNELKRTKDYMGRLKELEEKRLAPKVDKTAAKNFIRNALWQPQDKNNVTDGTKEISVDKEKHARKFEDRNGETPEVATKIAKLMN
ncbi:hypothetical protein AB6A40_001059 [Gnathostoma spinigerum]|uniref:Nuclear nucleic acid-binding protein C1D n=1 Tax=Gnathostoma spinigerum TaxID=75299 RepID=A0ABD6E4C1_9BILA